MALASLTASQKRALVFGGSATAVLGAGFAVAAVALPGALEALYRLAGPAADPSVGGAARLATGIYGGLMAGWGVTLALLGREVPVARAAGLGLVTWWAVDSAASIATGFPWNAVSNTAFLALFAPLVLGLGRRRAEA
ncbi:MAG: hypothetical protein U1F43_00905 [Myxococcota bacterium]